MKTTSIISSRGHRIAILRNMVETFASENTGPVLKFLHGNMYDQAMRDVAVARAILGELESGGKLGDGPIEVPEDAIR